MSTGRWSLALVTCVALLQVPLPTLHRHAEYAFADSLAEHLDTRHAAPVSRSDATQAADELHWHFVLPRDLRREHDSENDFEDNAPAAQASCLCLAVSSPLGAAAAGLSNPFDRPPHVGFGVALSTELAAKITARQTLFSVDCRPAVRPCALLCVLRC